MSFPAYGAYKDSGVEWLGAIPDHWNVARLGSLFEETVEAGSDDLPILSVSIHDGVSDSELSDDELDRKVTRSDDKSKYKQVRPGDLVYNMMRAWQGGFGTVLVHGMVSPAYVVARPRSPSQQTAFVEHILRTPNAVEEIRRHSQGVTDFRLRLYWDEFKNIRVPVPPPVEQGSILAFLARETDKIDTLIAEQQRLIDLLREKRQAMISHAVTKGLDPNVPMKDSGVAWLGDVPAHWDVTRLKFVASVQGGVAKGRDLADAETVEVPYLRVANVQDGYLDLNEIAVINLPPSELPRYLLRPGDVLMNEGGDFDKLGRGHIWRGEIETCIHQNHVFAVRPSSVEPEWLNLLTSAAFGRFYFMSRSKQSTNLASISSTNIKEFSMPCPPSAERLAIVEFVSRATYRIDALVSEAQSAITLLQERRSTLISAAVTGKIDVRGLASAEAEAA